MTPIACCLADQQHVYFFFTYRMYKHDLPGMQVDRTIGIRPVKTIFQIAFDRAADLRKLGAYLMMPSCQQVHFQQKIILTWPIRR